MTVNYKGKKITKTEKGWMTGGFLTYFNTLQEAKEAINAAIIEDKTLDDIDRYVKEVLGGYI